MISQHGRGGVTNAATPASNKHSSLVQSCIVVPLLFAVDACVLFLYHLSFTWSAELFSLLVLDSQREQRRSEPFPNSRNTEAPRVVIDVAINGRGAVNNINRRTMGCAPWREIKNGALAAPP